MLDELKFVVPLQKENTNKQLNNYHYEEINRLTYVYNSRQ